MARRSSLAPCRGRGQGSRAFPCAKLLSHLPVCVCVCARARACTCACESFCPSVRLCLCASVPKSLSRSVSPSLSPCFLLSLRVTVCSGDFLHEPRNPDNTSLVCCAGAEKLEKKSRKPRHLCIDRATIDRQTDRQTDRPKKRRSARTSVELHIHSVHSHSHSTRHLRLDSAGMETR